MNIQPKNKLETSFSLASMTDVIFLLLIFFMLTSSIVEPNGLPVDLPGSKVNNPVAPVVKVTVSTYLKYFVNGEEVPFAQIEIALQKALLTSSEKRIVLYIDKKVAVEHLVKLASIANKLGAKVAIATQLEAEKTDK
ncbi:MAG TPA: biopolymer transporter ExbD [Microscillaceae bacterium]|nr:biopolymer transporter ExbD [Microscillaceae bacterium]